MVDHDCKITTTPAAGPQSTLRSTMAVSCPTTPKTNATARATRRNRPTPAAPDRRLPKTKCLRVVLSAAVACLHARLACLLGAVGQLDVNHFLQLPEATPPRPHDVTPGHVGLLLGDLEGVISLCKEQCRKRSPSAVDAANPDTHPNDDTGQTKWMSSAWYPRPSASPQLAVLLGWRMLWSKYEWMAWKSPCPTKSSIATARTPLEITQRTMHIHNSGTSKLDDQQQHKTIFMRNTSLSQEATILCMAPDPNTARPRRLSERRPHGP